MRRLLRTIAAVAHDPSLPRWLKWGLPVVLAIPGPVDEALLGLALVVLLAIRWRMVRAHWRTVMLEPIEPRDTWGAWA